MQGGERAQEPILSAIEKNQYEKPLLYAAMATQAISQRFSSALGRHWTIRYGVIRRDAC